MLYMLFPSISTRAYRRVSAHRQCASLHATHLQGIGYLGKKIQNENVNVDFGREFWISSLFPPLRFLVPKAGPRPFLTLFWEKQNNPHLYILTLLLFFLFFFWNLYLGIGPLPAALRHDWSYVWSNVYFSYGSCRCGRM
jgi:hypothetical protein